MCRKVVTAINIQVELDASPAKDMEAQSRTTASIVWQNLHYSVTDPKKKSTKQILRGVSGNVAPKQLLAIMGPSGSGKTSLLNVLAGRTLRAKNALLEGSVTVNGERIGSSMHRISAYVEQDEALYAFSTVRETLMFAAQLRLPPKTSKADCMKRVMEVGSSLLDPTCPRTPSHTKPPQAPSFHHPSAWQVVTELNMVPCVDVRCAPAPTRSPSPNTCLPAHALGIARSLQSADYQLRPCSHRPSLATK